MYVFPVDPFTKAPKRKNFLNTADLVRDESELLSYVKNCGGAAGFSFREHVVIDLDVQGECGRSPKNEINKSSVDGLSEAVGASLIDSCSCVVKTGSGGLHLYYKHSNVDVKLKKSIAAFPGVEIKTHSVITPYTRIESSYYERKGRPQSLTSDGSYEYVRGSVFECGIFPPNLVDLLSYTPGSSKDSSIEYAVEKLRKLDPHDFREYDEWLTLMFASKSAGISFDDFNRWCKKDKKYDSPIHDKNRLIKWESAKSSGVSAKSLDYVYRNSGHSNRDILNFTEILKKDQPGKESCTVEVEKDDNTKKDGNKCDRSSLKDWIYVETLEKFYNTEGAYFNSLSGLTNAMSYCLEKLKISDLLKSNAIKRYVGLTFKPNDGKTSSTDNNRYYYYNTWKPPKIKPVQGDITRFIDFMKYYWPDDYAHALVWMACVAQGKRPRYMMLIHSANNQIGKSSIIGAIMKNICGEDNTVSLKERHIHGQHNGYLARCHLAIIEEMHAGMNKLQFYNTIKEMITEDRIMIDEKYLQSYMIDNHAVFLAFTNYLDSMTVSKDDPRVLFLSTFGEKRSIEYYDNFRKWMYNGGIENVYDYLLRYPLESGDHIRAPNTKAKSDLAEATKKEADIFLDDYLFDHDNELVKEMVCLSKFKHRINGKTLTHKRVKVALINKGYTKLELTIENCKQRLYISPVAAQKAASQGLTLGKYVRANWQKLCKLYTDILVKED